LGTGQSFQSAAMGAVLNVIGILVALSAAAVILALLFRPATVSVQTSAARPTDMAQELPAPPHPPELVA
jgi:hypothetical protein